MCKFASSSWLFKQEPAQAYRVLQAGSSRCSWVTWDLTVLLDQSCTRVLVYCSTAARMRAVS